LSLALGSGAGWLRLATLLMLPVLGVLLGAVRPLAGCLRVLLLAWRRHHGGAHDESGREEGLLPGAPPDQRGRPRSDAQPPGSQMCPAGRRAPVDRHPVAHPHPQVRVTLA
jgi:hypothetical protein